MQISDLPYCWERYLTAKEFCRQRTRRREVQDLEGLTNQAIKEKVIMSSFFSGWLRKGTRCISYSPSKNEQGNVWRGWGLKHITGTFCSLFFKTGLISPRSALLIWWWTFFHEVQLNVSLLKKARAHFVSSPCPHHFFVLLFPHESGGKKRGQVSKRKAR